jgi:D-alanyl-D-alanine carboxypeptidase/D-alanyl-D-alanine-endopeptidase (penicillin-binding protein 4)
MIRYALLLLLAFTSSAASLAERINQLIAASPTARAAFFGVEAVDLSSGKTLVELNPRNFFIPASNTKLFTTSMALLRLGPDFTFRTRVMADDAPDADGRIHGPLRLIGGGDPNLSPRPIPYRVGPVTGDPLGAIAELADQIAERGVTRVDGDIIGDDSWYTWEPFSSGWSVDDPLYDYGAPVSALSINDNSLTLHAQPGGDVGEAASLQLNPPIDFYHIDNRLATVAAKGILHAEVKRVPGSRELQVWGAIPLDSSGPTFGLGIEDPAEFAAIALRQALEERGITVTGSAVARHQFPNQVADLKQAPPSEPPAGVELASHTSAPLLEDLRITDKVSQNLHADMALRAVGRARRNIGSREAGLEEMKTFLDEAGISPDAWHISDGSGLSRTNLVTPETVVKLLRFVYDSPVRESFISLLPVGGQDGTLKNRFADIPGAARVHAKTGTVAHVSALSGYMQRANGNWIVFSVLVNNYNGPSGEITHVMDRICALIME